MIRHIVFDMGQVLVNFNIGLFTDRLRLSEADAALPGPEMEDAPALLAAENGTVGNAVIYYAFDNGVNSNRYPYYSYMKDYWNGYGLDTHLDMHGTAEYLVRQWNDPIVPVEGMADVARDLKNAGYDLYLLSNASTRQHTYWHDIPGSEYFSGTFISADYRLLKPEDAIYQAFFRKFGLKPEDCLFIDDSPANIEASENAGMAGIVFHGDAAHLRCQLADRGIL